MSEQPSTSPPPPAGDGSGAGAPPQTIGIRFVKTYYQVLSTNPDQIFKFYKPSSCLSHGEGSTPSTATGFENYDLADRWGSVSRFDFDNGAIDAQPSANGSILLVVTGHVVRKVEGKEERKGFVHTFFLALQVLPNKQKTYYVHNDILRFLKDDQEEAATEKSSSKADEAAKSNVKAKPAEEPTVVEEKNKEPESQDESPGGGVEETKEVAPDEESDEQETTAEKKVDKPKEEPVAKESSSPAEDKKKEQSTNKDSENAGKEGSSSGGGSGGGKGKRQRGRGKSPAEQQNTPKQQPASKPVPPSSWASLVASNSGPVPSPAQTPSKAAAPEKTESTPAKTSSNAQQSQSQEKSETQTAKENGKGGKDRPKRDPDNTLVIKNLPDNTKEAELLAIFDRFAVQTKGKIVSSTISNHRGLAFVDYDSVAPVMAAVELHKKEPIQMGGRVLEVDQKTAEQRARKMRGGGYRSGSPGQNRGGGSGRQNKRDRGSGGGRSGNKGNKGAR